MGYNTRSFGILERSNVDSKLLTIWYHKLSVLGIHTTCRYNKIAACSKLRHHVAFVVQSVNVYFDVGMYVFAYTYIYIYIYIYII